MSALAIAPKHEIQEDFASFNPRLSIQKTRSN
jgi:hypothetical protein